MFRKAPKPEGLNDADVDIDEADAADGPAKVGIHPKDTPLGAQVGEPIWLPEIAPGKENQEKADLKTKDHVQYARELVIPAIFIHAVGLRASIIARTGAKVVRCCGVGPYFSNASKWAEVP